MLDFLCTISFLKPLISSCALAGALAAGYVEGEYVLIAPIETAIIESLAVRRGDRFIAGQALAILETRDAELDVRQGEAALALSQSQLSNLLEGKRPEEIAVIVAELESAKVQVQEAARIFRRQSELLTRGTTSQASYDTALTNLNIATANVAQMEANLAVARLPARAEEIKAARASVDEAQAALEAAEWRLQQRTLTSPRPGVVSDVIRNPGEVAGPLAPVLSVLPDGAVKLRLYVPEPSLARISLGKQLQVQCDGCPTGMTATVSYISPDPEFTPPVIYSLENRQKLVFLIEANPDPTATSLKPGQIVDVALQSDSK